MSIESLAREFEQQRAGAFDLEPGPEAVLREVRVVAEGDSWFDYFPAYDVLATLRRRRWDDREYKVFDRADAGALLNDMVYGRDMVDTFQLIKEHKPEVFLFSGGGNDIAGQELFVLLYHRKAVELHGALPRINASILRGLVHEVFERSYRDMIELVRWKATEVGLGDLPIVLHGYGYAIPDGRGWAGGWGPLPGPWLDPSLTRKGYDREKHAAIRRDIVRELIDAFNDMQKVVASSYPAVHHVDLREVLGDSDWGNELHPTEAGFRKVTRRIEETIRSVT